MSTPLALHFRMALARTYARMVYCCIMALRNMYTDREKAEALVALEQHNGNATATERSTGIPAETLTAWRSGRGVNRDVARLCELIQRGLDGQIEDIVQMTLAQIPKAIPAATYNQLMVGLGIGIDKMLILRGQASSITENRNVTVNLDGDDPAVQQLLQSALDRLRQRDANDTGLADKSQIASDDDSSNILPEVRDSA